MPLTTRIAASLLTAALLLSTTACGEGEPASDRSEPFPTLSSDPEAQDLDRVGSILPSGAWTLVDAEGIGGTEGEYEVNAAGATAEEPPEVTVTWRPAEQYAGYVEDRAAVSSPETVDVLGSPGMLYTYSDHDFTVLRTVQGASFIELRGTFLSRADFDAFLTSLDTTTEEEFAAALVDAGVTPKP